MSCINMKKHINYESNNSKYDYLNSFNLGFDDFCDLLKNNLNDTIECKKDISKLKDVFMYLLGTRNLIDYSYYTDEAKECSDGSDLSALIKYEGKDTIVNLGYWEFNAKVFNTKNVNELKWFYMCPIPLFVVNQRDSYAGNNEYLTMKIKEPKKYLEEFAVIISPKWWDAYYRGYKGGKNIKKIDYNHIHVRHYEDALLSGRLAILEKEFPNWSFMDAVRILKDFQDLNFEKFYFKTYKNEKYLSENQKKLLWCLRNMWVNRVGSGVWDRDAYQSLFDLIQSFDVQKKIFLLPEKVLNE